MKKNCFNISAFLMMFVYSENNFSQNNLWYLTKGLSTDEVAWAVDTDADGNIYWAIEEKDVWPYWYYNIHLFKIDSNAQQIWQTAPYGNAYNDIAFVAKVSGNKIYLGGRSDTTGALGSGNALVACYNISDGSFNWDYVYDQGFGYEEIDGLDIQPDGIYLTGWTQGQSSNMDFLIHKINLSGQQQWTNSWDYANGFDGANGHCALDDNFIYAAGHANLTMGELACFSRMDGSFQWGIPWSDSSNDEALGMTMNSDSILYTVGYFSSTSSQTNLRKYSRTGELKWSATWGGAGTEDSRSLVADGDSIIFVTGTTSSYENGGRDIFILKYDSSGVLLDSLIWGGSYDEVAKDVAMYGEYLYITGETESFGNGQINGDHKTDCLLLKINGRKMLAPDTALTVASETQISEENFSVFPNPTSGKLTVIASEAKQSKIELYNLFGEKIYQSKIQNPKSEIDLSNQPNGIYFLKILSDENTVTRKIIIQK